MWFVSKEPYILAEVTMRIMTDAGLAVWAGTAAGAFCRTQGCHADGHANGDLQDNLDR